MPRYGVGWTFTITSDRLAASVVFVPDVIDDLEREERRMHLGNIAHACMRGMGRAVNAALSWSPALRAITRSLARRGIVKERIWRALSPVGQHRLHTPGGETFTYIATPEDQLAVSLVWTDLQDWEETTIPFFCDLAKRSSIVVDVGAYTGIYTLLACASNPTIRVVAFEPNRMFFEALLRNVQVNGFSDRVRAEAKAVLSEPGIAHLHVPADTSASRVVRNSRPGSALRQIDVTTIDAALQDWPVDLVKIDVEGLELEVLEGAASVLRKSKPAIIIECLGLSFSDVHRMLTMFDYQYFYNCGPQGLKPMRPGGNRPRRYVNFLCCVDEPSDLLAEHMAV